MLPRRPSLTEDKLLLLYTIDSLEPITAEQLLLFLVEKELMDYITLQLVLAELCEAGLLVKHAHELGALYRLSAEGLEMLELFGSRVPFSRVQRVREAADAWRARFEDEREMVATYTQLPEGDYLVRLLVNEEDIALMDISLRIPSREQAILFAGQWPKKAGTLYANILRTLNDQTTSDE